jgi:uncharacterized membrane protein YcaP (DUF421 family)
MTIENMLIPRWAEMFVPDVPPVEIFLRGSLLYISIFVLLRLVLKRETASVGISDLLIIVLLSDAAQNAMSDEYHSITDGLLLVGTIMFWGYFLDWLGYRFPLVQQLIHPPPLLLVKNGTLLVRNMRKELITIGELKSLLREQGIENIAEVREHT